jgi:hypothetical protein
MYSYGAPRIGVSLQDGNSTSYPDHCIDFSKEQDICRTCERVAWSQRTSWWIRSLTLILDRRLMRHTLSCPFQRRVIQISHLLLCGNSWWHSVPTMIPKSLGYHHHGNIYPISPARSRRSNFSPGIEYWQNPDPPSQETTHQCSADGEDPSCSASVPSKGITPAHVTVRLRFLLDATSD